MNVIIVDDQGQMRTLVQRILEGFGITGIRCTASPVEALALARSGRFQLVISDYTMPEMDGLELLARIRKDPATNNPHVIMLTGSGERSIVEKAVSLGVSDYVVKPFRAADLRAKIQRLFGDLS
ncbi:response regulator [Sphingosinicella terrae]|uniref:response regulator n=1 Tax=Sphingosinicella terrae TaxID=2172047 RepID=UPI002549710D|nr:response regulator [Sphingosinicella terrae]